MSAILPSDPILGKDPEELASGILDFLEKHADDPELKIVITQGAAQGKLICLATEERCVRRRKREEALLARRRAP